LGSCRGQTKLGFRRAKFSADESGGQPPQSRRSAPYQSLSTSRSVWTAVALAPLFGSGIVCRLNGTPSIARLESAFTFACRAMLGVPNDTIARFFAPTQPLLVHGTIQKKLRPSISVSFFKQWSVSSKFLAATCSPLFFSAEFAVNNSQAKIPTVSILQANLNYSPVAHRAFSVDKLCTSIGRQIQNL
jgi:hypothetical protein